MSTVVLLTVFLLAASANPIQESSDNSTDISGSGPHNLETPQPSSPEEGSPTSTEDSTGNHSKEDRPVDYLTVPTDDVTAKNTGDELTSSVSAVSSTSAKPDTSTLQNDLLNSTPEDADPTDCRNASERNHAYLLCTYLCQGDEMFTAPNYSVCYLHPANVTTKIPMMEEYQHAENSGSGLGVCIDGQCVPKSTDTTTASTESSPAQSTSSEAGGKTESTINENTPATTEKTNSVSGHFPEQSTAQNTSAGDISTQENSEAPEAPKLLQ